MDDIDEKMAITTRMSHRKWFVSAKCSRRGAWWTQLPVQRNSDSHSTKIHVVTTQDQTSLWTLQTTLSPAAIPGENRKTWMLHLNSRTASSCKQAIWLVPMFKALIVFTNWPAKLQLLLPLPESVIADTSWEKKWGGCKEEGRTLRPCWKH